MNCHYCYEHVSGTHRQGIIHVEDVLSYLSNFVDYEHVFVLFHGGEPLLTPFYTIQTILDYIHDQFLGVYHIQFQTNGTLLNDAWIALFQKYGSRVSLSISLDPVGSADLRFAEGYHYREKVEQNLCRYANAIENIGVVSVAHVYNKRSFLPFIEQLINMRIGSITINKYRANMSNDEFFISEYDYVKLLKDIFYESLRKKWYRKINIQPLNALFSEHINRLCIYLPDEHKCSYFKTFYNLQDVTNFCDHVPPNVVPHKPAKCVACDLYTKCGGGCFMEEKDGEFCAARRELFQFIQEVKSEYSKSDNK